MKMFFTKYDYNHICKATLKKRYHLQKSDFTDINEAERRSRMVHTTTLEGSKAYRHILS